jgi:hypothetical protein
MSIESQLESGWRGAAQAVEPRPGCDIAEVVSAPSGPNPARMAEVMTRYGLLLAPPKPTRAVL